MDAPVAEIAESLAHLNFALVTSICFSFIFCVLRRSPVL